MTTAKPEPWHKVVRLKDELRSGELSLAEFAADLHEVTLGQGKRPVYEDPARFFALTYPTHALRELVKDVAERLAGKSTKAVRQLELTYGRRQRPTPSSPSTTSFAIRPHCRG